MVQQHPPWHIAMPGAGAIHPINGGQWLTAGLLGTGRPRFLARVTLRLLVPDPQAVRGAAQLAGDVGHRRRQAPVAAQMVDDHLHRPRPELRRVRARRVLFPVHGRASFESFALRASRGGSQPEGSTAALGPVVGIGDARRHDGPDPEVPAPGRSAAVDLKAPVGGREHLPEGGISAFLSSTSKPAPPRLMNMRTKQKHVSPAGTTMPDSPFQTIQTLSQRAPDVRGLQLEHSSSCPNSDQPNL